MSRQPRNTGEYLHVIIRGIGKQVLFEEDADRKYYLSLLKKYRDVTGMTILAYCLMENHVHLLLKDPSGQVSVFMQKTGVSYAGYYNRKYERTGHLFQDRYKSENISDGRYLVAAFRYILLNPQKAGIAPAREYRWSSYADYGRRDAITDTLPLETVIGEKEALDAYLEEDDEREFLEDTAPKHDDAWALDVIKKTLNVVSGTALQSMPKKQRDEALAMLKKKGISVRRLERLTGINRGVIQKAK